MKTIINPWKNPHYGTGKDYAFDDSEKPLFVYGDYSIWKNFEKSYVYAYKGKAFNELAGFNKEHLISVADRSGHGFLYDRAMNMLEGRPYND